MNQDNLFPGIVLVLPQTPTKGKVVMTSSATKMIVGDVVLFNPEPFVEITKNNVTYRVVREEDILGWYIKIPRFNPE